MKFTVIAATLFSTVASAASLGNTMFEVSSVLSQIQGYIRGRIGHTRESGLYWT